MGPRPSKAPATAPLPEHRPTRLIHDPDRLRPQSLTTVTALLLQVAPAEAKAPAAAPAVPVPPPAPTDPPAVAINAPPPPVTVESLLASGQPTWEGLRRHLRPLPQRITGHDHTEWTIELPPIHAHVIQKIRALALFWTGHPTMALVMEIESVIHFKFNCQMIQSFMSWADPLNMCYHALFLTELPFLGDQSSNVVSSYLCHRVTSRYLFDMLDGCTLHAQLRFANHDDRRREAEDKKGLGTRERFGDAFCMTWNFFMLRH